jgi:hypothetical protein
MKQPVPPGHGGKTKKALEESMSERILETVLRRKGENHDEHQTGQCICF